MNILAQAAATAQEMASDAAQETAATAGFFQNQTLMALAGILIAIPVAVFLGRFLGKTFKIPDQSWRIGLVFWCIVVSVLVISTKQLKFGVDLRGGVTIIGQLNEQKNLEPGQEPVKIQDMIPTLKDRIDPSGVKEIVIRGLGTDKLEVIIPDVDKEEAERIWKRLTSAGQLFFRIVADENNPAHQTIFAAARESMLDRRVDVFGSPDDEHPDGKKIGHWFGLAREQAKSGQTGPRNLPFKFLPSASHLLRNMQTGEPIDIASIDLDSDEDVARQQFSQWCAARGIQDVEILMVHPSTDRENVEGKYLTSVSKGYDDTANPRIEFKLTAAGGRRLYSLTQRNKPTNGRYSLLGIVLDDRLQAAPRINEPIRTDGVIEGRFTEDEIENYKAVLSSGKLDVALQKNWISMDQILSTLGEELKTKGITAIGISLGLVLVFMLVYYRFCGVVACVALALNLLFTMGILMLINVNLTLTGLAGLVLTIGMSVDANVLIFERIREELERGTALRMAIRNGFDRATTTIVDANVTTLITAIILYVIGTDQIRSFAVTLIVGILMCMFSAIFCSRILFSIAERNRWISELHMSRIVGNRLFDFLSKRRIAAVASLLVLLIGLSAFFARGRGILDTDLAGGSTARIEFIAEMPVSEIKSALEQSEFRHEGDPIRYQVTQMKDNNLAFKIDSSLPVIEDEAEEDQLRLDTIIAQVFAGKLKMLGMNYDPAAIRIANSEGAIVPRGSEPEDEGPSLDNPPSAGGPNANPDNLGRYESRGIAGWSALLPTGPQQDEPPADPSPENQSGQSPAETTGEAVSEQVVETPEGDMVEAAEVFVQDPPGEVAAETPRQSRERFTATTELTFEFPISGESVKGWLTAAANQLGNVPLADRDIQLKAPGADSLKARSDSWNVVIDIYEKDDANRIFAKAQEMMSAEPYFASSSGVGGQVAGQTQWKALVAMIASLLGIVAYVWIRFQNVAFGLAAIVALVHDVLIVLGAIAISHWLAGALGFLLIDDFRISLSVVAALLTVIGYSLNDTIVVFDRVREVRGKRQDITADMINQSISQTLSRTILTSLTTFLVVIILYIMGGDSIHAFAFALVIGIIVGTYSSIFVASPVLLWLMNRGVAPPPVAAQKSSA